MRSLTVTRGTMTVTFPVMCGCAMPDLAKDSGGDFQGRRDDCAEL